MKLLKTSFSNVKLFKDGIFKIDLFASDRVIADDESVYKIKEALYTNNVIALSGINGSGKTISLSLLLLALEILAGEPLDTIMKRERDYSGLFQFPFRMKSLFYHDHSFYVLSSLIGRNDSIDDAFGSANKYLFAEEEIYKLPVSSVTKKLLGESIEQIILQAPLFTSRKKINETSSVFLPVNQSLTMLVGSSKRRGLGLFESDYPFIDAGNMSDALNTILRAFDPGIEEIEVYDKGRAYKISFRNSEEPIVTDREGLTEIFSSGTLKGLLVVQFALAVLKAGGYLLLDEIENHLNHQLVRLILDLFMDKETNPKGATLIFSTHYAEILDHLHRKDCVYFLPRIENGKTEVVKYSSRVKRIENKKSEVFASNYVKGTAPSFREINVLKKYVKQNV